MQDIITDAKSYIKTMFEQDYSGHDYFHSLRVYKTAIEIAEKEKADIMIVSLAALLHDVDDQKLFPDTYENKDNAVDFLKGKNILDEQITSITEIIEEVSFKGTDTVTPETIEGKCVQDADRLDALGAIGIARAFAYGGCHNRLIFDPEIKPDMNMNKEEYRKNTSTTVNHFYEKLFLLKDFMNTKSGFQIAVKREQFMKKYLEEFMIEWNGEDRSGTY